MLYIKNRVAGIVLVTDQSEVLYMNSKEKQLVMTLCGDKCDGCPQIFTDNTAESTKQVVVTDDFGNTIAMSKDQFRVLVKGSKEGKLDI
ncbi:MAG: hypothetical protein Q7S11_01825 [bacterium]|nr:hypothetical protein [bacterium]